ncbi:MAG: glycosyltransferase family 2 protein [Xylanivirga thermophila]|jgi:glycosyltransferase involved in cell wall biosynthesis|uniref:glycosyltransferase family 2 protein n=1 Tax=Xylanivirga thermophila TaxID=2496273 RepID=UPI0039F609C8
MTIQQPDISVVIPMYNREKYIKEAIESILEQTFQNFEIIVLDDFSSDHSCEVLKSIEDPRIILYTADEKSGIAKLRNIGNDMARGKYIAVMDSDDIMPSYRLKEQFDFLENNPDVGVVGGHCKMFGDYEGMLLNNWDSDTINCGHLYRTLVFHGTSMIRKSVLKEFNLKYNEDYFVGEDWALWVDMINKVKLVNLDRCFLYYRIHDQSISKLSQDNRKLKARRRSTLDKIRMTAFNNLGFKLEEEELVLFKRFFGEVDKDLPKFTQGEYEKVKIIISKLKCQAEDLEFNAEAFSKFTDMWSKKMAKRHGIFYEED